MTPRAQTPSSEEVAPFLLDDLSYQIGKPGGGTLIDYGSAETCSLMQSLPAWAYDLDALRVCKDGGCCYVKHQAQPGICWSLCSIGAWRHVAIGTFLLWMFWGLFPLATYMASECGSPNELATTSSWIWVLFVVFLPGMVLCEWQAHKFIFPVWMRFLGSYEILSFNPPVWLCSSFVVFASCIMRADIATQSMLLGKLMRTELCKGNLVETMWQYVISQSQAAWIPSLKQLAFGIWGLMSLQFLLALGSSVPFRDEEAPLKKDTSTETYSICSLLRQQSTPEKFAVQQNFASGLVWQTLLGGHITLPCHSMKALAQAGRMNLPMLRHRDFMQMTFCLNTELIKALHPVESAAKRMLAYTEILADDLFQSALHCFLVLVLQVSPTLQLQGSLLALVKMTNRSIDPTVAISLCFSVLTAGHTLGLAVVLVFKSFRMMQQFQTNCQECDLDKTPQWQEQFSSLNRRVSATLVAMSLAAIFSAVNLVYIGVKIWMAFACPLGAWSLNGCVSEYPSWWTEKVPYSEVTQDMACFFQYSKIHAINADTCAIACSMQVGCSVFSYSTGNGCRISACGMPHALSTGHDCGYADGRDAVSIARQCGTRKSSQSTLYYLPAFDVIGTNVACIAQYINSPAPTPLCCKAECAAKSNCYIFSFSDEDGCRISACNDPAASGSREKCGTSTGAAVFAAIGQCSTDVKTGSFLYAFKREQQSSS